MKRLLRALVATLAIGGHAQAQLLSMSAALSPRGLPPNVSIPAVTSSSVSYPGCPGEVTSHAHTFYVDQVNGHTQSGGGTGAIGAPWDSLQALTGNNAGTPTAGYTQILLSTAPGGNGSSPVKPGDLVVVNTGSYGDVIFGASTQIVNNPALTIQAGAGQTPLLTTLNVNEVVGLHIEGTSGSTNFMVRSVNPGTNAYLVSVYDNNVPLSTSDIILENMDISSGSVATFNAFSKASWITNARPGLIFNSFFDNTPATTMQCVSLVNSHVYEVSRSGFGAVEGESASILIQGNEIDHMFPTGIKFNQSNVAIGHNYVHDFVEASLGDPHYAVVNGQSGGLTPSLFQSNVYIYNNKMLESVDSGQTFQSAASFYLNTGGDITNFVAWDNLGAGGGSCAICTGNSHDFLVANNSFMFSGTGQNPNMNLSQEHNGGTGPIGLPPSNGWVFNNIANQFNNVNGSGVQTYHNIAAPGATGFAVWVYTQDWAQVFASPTPGSVTTLSSISGQQNLLDGGIGGGAPQANEFTAVPAANSFPMSPQPDWTPKTGSSAKTAGAIVTIPAIPDYNGITNNSIGALN